MFRTDNPIADAENYMNSIDNAKGVCACDECGAQIFEGDDYYDFGGDCICENCKDDYVTLSFKRVAYRED